MKKPAASIGIVWNESRTEVLLVKRRDVPIWVLPGGGIEPEESAEKAVIREVFEETGLHIAIKKPFATFTPINSLSYVTYIFECKKVGGKETLTEESSDVGFFPSDKLPSPLFFLHKSWILENQTFKDRIIQRPLKEITYFRFFLYFLRHPIWVTKFLWTRLKNRSKC